MTLFLHLLLNFFRSGHNVLLCFLKSFSPLHVVRQALFTKKNKKTDSTTNNIAPVQNIFAAQTVKSSYAVRRHSQAVTRDYLTTDEQLAGSEEEFDVWTGGCVLRVSHMCRKFT